MQCGGEPQSQQPSLGPCACFVERNACTGPVQLTSLKLHKSSVLSFCHLFCHPFPTEHRNSDSYSSITCPAPEVGFSGWLLSGQMAMVLLVSRFSRLQVPITESMPASWLFQPCYLPSQRLYTAVFSTSIPSPTLSKRTEKLETGSLGRPEPIGVFSNVRQLLSLCRRFLALAQQPLVLQGRLWQPAEDSPHPSLLLTFPVAQEMLSRQGAGQEGAVNTGSVPTAVEAPGHAAVTCQIAGSLP